MDRTAWESLPSELRDAVRAELGPPAKVEPIPEARRSALAALAHLDSGRVLLKGAPLGSARLVDPADLVVNLDAAVQWAMYPRV